MEDYNPLVYDLIANILRSYDPINIYHVSALWVFWVTWCKHFYDPDPVEDRKVEVLTNPDYDSAMSHGRTQFIQKIPLLSHLLVG